MTSHAHRQHTVSLLLFYAGEGVVQDLVSSSFFCMRSGADTCQPHGSVSRLLRRIIRTQLGAFADLVGSSFPLALWDMFGLVKFKISGFCGQLCS